MGGTVRSNRIGTVGAVAAALAMTCVAVRATASAAIWSDLWTRPDQRAQSLLDSGQAAAAAPLFDDPRRRAYAEIKAQQFADAAKQLKPYSDPESQYNRGNALARSGQLHDALAAYESTLAQAPASSALYRDAVHNRDLVAQQLKSQQSAAQKQQSAKGGRPPSGKSDQDQSPGGQAEAGQSPAGQSQPGQSQPDQARQEQAAKNQAAKDQAGKDQAKGQQGSSSGAQGASAQDRPEQDQSQQNQPQGRSQQAGESAANHDQLASNQSAADAKATQDAAAAARADVAPAPKDHAGRQVAAAGDAKPESEQAMALDQWLRWIPDDPSGLLRRKFMIEHMMKQREEQR